MLPVFTSEQMRACDSAAIKEFGIPGIVLMENAARGAADVLEHVLGTLTGKCILLLCGKGNNGGDGFAIARHIVNRGGTATCLLPSSARELKDDAKTNLDIFSKMSGQNDQAFVQENISPDAVRAQLATKPDAILDAFFGTGLTSGLKDTEAEIARMVNRSNVPVLSVDIPSGIHSDTGLAPTVAIKAQHTVTMGALKRGLLLNEGRIHAGEIHVADIGIPRGIFQNGNPKTFLLEESDARALLPPRAFNLHKYQAGKVFCIAGSVGMTGAAALASEAALRAGAGIVHLAIPESLNAILEEKVTEVITLPMEETSAHAFSRSNLERLLRLVSEAHCSILGPGVSRNDETLELAREIIASISKPLVVDADALFALIDRTDILLKSKAPLILTPHNGEFARLIGKTSREIEHDRIDLARNFAAQFHCTLVLKGAPTVTATQVGDVFINPTGNPGMASAGTGDVLAGIIGGLVAQGLTLEQAAYTGVFIHGRAGDAARDRIGEHGMLATDVLEYVSPSIQIISNAS